MTGSPFCRNSLRFLRSLQLGSWALGMSDRGGQDKSRKVRTVGWLRISARFGLLANIASVSCNLGFFENALSALNF
jgi:hypothetical protein